MGSWFGTCGISQLPLIDEPIVMIPIVQTMFSQEGNDHVSSTDRWAPIGVPLYGTYDDFGHMSLTGNQYLIHLVNTEVIRPDLIESLKEHNKVNSQTILDFDSYQNTLHVNELFINQIDYTSDYLLVPAAIGRMFILRSIWDDLINNYRPTNYTEVTQDLEYTRNQVRNTIIPITQVSRRMKLISGNTIHFARITDVVNRQHLSTVINDVPTELTNQLINQLSELSVFGKVMTTLRKTYMPQSGLGSLMCDYDYYQILIDSMQRVINTANKR